MDTVGAVAVVFVLLLGLLVLVRRLAGPAPSTSEYLKVLDSVALAPGRTVALVEVAGRCLLVGTTATRVDKLAEFPAADLPAPERQLGGAANIRARIMGLRRTSMAAQN